MIQKPLSSSLHLRTAAIERKPIAVYLDDELIASGAVEDITDHAIRISGEWHFFSMCEFYYAK